MRIFGVNVPGNKRVEISLTYIYGIGRSTARKILDSCVINRDLRSATLTEEQVASIRDYIRANCVVESDKRKEILSDIKRLQDVGCYRARRRKRGLPVRGQRTHTNARTCGGKRKGRVQVANKKK